MIPSMVSQWLSILYNEKEPGKYCGKQLSDGTEEYRIVKDDLHLLLKFEARQLRACIWQLRAQSREAATFRSWNGHPRVHGNTRISGGHGSALLSFFLSDLLNYGKVDGLDLRTQTYDPGVSCCDLGRV